MSCYIQQEENLDRYRLEDATGFLLLEDCEPEPFGPPRPGEIRFMDDGDIAGRRDRTGRIVLMTEGRARGAAETRRGRTGRIVPMTEGEID